MGNNTTKEKGHLLTIGTVAKSFGVNENTIRRIEAAGLLEPAIISKDSGYRYYDIENLSRLSEILSLREFGFVYEDLREFFSEGGNYAALYQKLIEKQLAINALVDKFSYRMNAREYLECRIIDFTEAHCLCKEATMIPTTKNISDFARSFLYEAIQAGVRINYTRAIIILTECGDYRCFQIDVPQKLVFGIPLMAADDKTATQHFAAGQAVSCGWIDPPHESADLDERIHLIQNEFDLHGFKQCGTLRLTYNISGYLNDNAIPGGAGIHILVPFA